jgi:lipopolysaccharide export system permease protein
MKLLDKYIINECWFPFFAGCGIVTGVWLGADQVREALSLLAHSNANFGTALSLILLELPTVLLATIPIGVFFACFLVFNKLSSDSELIALRAGGISLLRITLPTLYFGLVLCLLSIFIGEIVIPWTGPLAEKIKFVASRSTSFNPKMKDFIYTERAVSKKLKNGDLKRLFHVKKIYFKSNKLQDVTIIDFSEPSRTQIYFAKSAYLDVKEGAWVLEKCNTFSSLGNKKTSFTGYFDQIYIPSGKSVEGLISKLKDKKYLNILGLISFLKEQKKQGIICEKTASLTMKLHEKIAYPFSAIAMALVSAPMGVGIKRAKINWGYIYMGFVILIYYTLLTSLVSLGETNTLHPFLAAWIPNFFLIITGSCILYKKSNFSMS